MIPIYLAAPWSERDQLTPIIDKLFKAGFYPTEPWWSHEDTSDPQELIEQAKLDARGVLRADAFILLNTQPRGQETTGKAVEMGIALAERIPIILVGERTNVFHYLPSVTVVSSIEEAIDELRRQGFGAAAGI